MFLTEYDEKFLLDQTFEEGRETGLKQGRKLGLEQGQDQILLLISQLLKDNRLEDLDKALSDKHYLITLLHEYHLD